MSYWQAVGIVILARLIFGGFGHRGHNKGDYSDSKRFGSGGHHDFFNRMLDRFHGWDPEPEPKEAPISVPEEDLQRYREFWEKEGRQAFADYMSRKDRTETD